MSIVLGIGDPLTLAGWLRDMRGQSHDCPWPWYPHAGDPPPPDIGTGHYQPPPIPQGWQCPLCKTVYAPFVAVCRCDVENAITLRSGNSDSDSALAAVTAERDALRAEVTDLLAERDAIQFAATQAARERDALRKQLQDMEGEL